MSKYRPNPYAQRDREHEEWKNKMLKIGKTAHYQKIVDEYNSTEDKSLLNKVSYGCGYIAGVCGKRHPFEGDGANYYEYGYQAGANDKAEHDKKGGK